MPDAGEALVEVKVKRYDLARMQLGQLALPFAVILTILARRNPSVLLIVGAILLQGSGLYAFLSASKRFGWQPLRFEGGSVSFGDTGLRLEGIQIQRWTFVDGTARLYGSTHSFELQARPGTDQVMSALLGSVFGSPVRLVRRGSTTSIVLALCASVFGLVLSGIAIAQDDKRLLLGMPFFVFGLIAVGVLRSRVAR
jgi:hypothetical protein